MKNTMKHTKDNVKDGLQIAGSVAAVNKLIDVLDHQLREAGVDTSFLQTPVGRSVASLALPTLIMAVCEVPQLEKTLGAPTVEALQDVASSAQLGASINGATTLINVLAPVLAEFAKVKGTLPDGADTPTIDQLFQKSEA